MTAAAVNMATVQCGWHVTVRRSGTRLALIIESIDLFLFLSTLGVIFDLEN